MFQRHGKPFSRLLSLLDDVLGDPQGEAPPHPHRRELRWQPVRRPGSVAASPAHCIAPVRPGSPSRRRERITADSAR